ncbi:hypothetical protein P7K49_037947 [Saguinus oedipus]|uniref:Uncharacterized protein n=1 Tax=Saguinus oedipus TaxID=9490 RepID=A0ABQ9TDD5_SAGOE|nr:hypothetical protein P7K49_037947 [Saguinus oedipus]
MCSPLGYTQTTPQSTSCKVTPKPLRPDLNRTASTSGDFSPKLPRCRPPMRPRPDHASLGLL